jgi:rRNA maturation RNase YbeY
MRKLNKLHRGINKATDVLSFPASPEKGQFQHLGDIVISLEEAEKKAKRIGISRRRQVETLIIHGFLHLCGHDHEKDSGQMIELQAALEKELLGNEPLPISKRRGRKPGSKIKTLKSGERVVVTGRAAQAIVRREKLEKVKPAAKTKKLKAKKTKAKKTKIASKARVKTKNRRTTTVAGATKPKRAPGRPRKATATDAAKPLVRHQPRKKRAAPPRSGIIA